MMMMMSVGSDGLLSMLDHGFELCSGQTKDYQIGIYYFSAKHAAKT
jgi:hypothetical protein